MAVRMYTLAVWSYEDRVSFICRRWEPGGRYGRSTFLDAVQVPLSGETDLPTVLRAAADALEVPHRERASRRA